MELYLQTLFMMPLAILFIQFYLYAVSLKGEERQKSCRLLGIMYMSLGITSLVTRSVPISFGGLIMIMLGFRLMAHGLNRLDKRIYIDRFDEEA
jgi:hypothetical protein